MLMLTNESLKFPVPPGCTPQTTDEMIYFCIKNNIDLTDLYTTCVLYPTNDLRERVDRFLVTSVKPPPDVDWEQLPTEIWQTVLAKTSVNTRHTVAKVSKRFSHLSDSVTSPLTRFLYNFGLRCVYKTEGLITTTVAMKRLHFTRAMLADVPSSQLLVYPSESEREFRLKDLAENAIRVFGSYRNYYNYTEKCSAIAMQRQTDIQTRRANLLEALAKHNITPRNMHFNMGLLNYYAKTGRGYHGESLEELVLGYRDIRFLLAHTNFSLPNQASMYVSTYEALYNGAKVRATIQWAEQNPSKEYLLEELSPLAAQRLRDMPYYGLTPYL